MGYESAWLTPYERYVWECEEGSCFYSVDVFCEVPLDRVPGISERLELSKGWAVVFLRMELEGVGPCEAELVVGEGEEAAQLVNIKLWTGKRLEASEVDAIRRKVCKALGGASVTFNSTVLGG